MAREKRWVWAFVGLFIGCGSQVGDQDYDLGITQQAAVAKGIYVSLSSDRTNARALDQSVVIGDVAYVFADGFSNVTSVDFYRVDSQSRIQHTEHYAPYDFGGTASDGRANPVSFASLPAGQHQINIRVNHKDGTTERYAAAFSRGSAAPAALSFSPTSYDFKQVAVGSSSAARTFTVTNTGAGAASNVYLAIASGAQFAISSSACGTTGAPVTIAGGGTCTFSVVFRPTSAGVKSDTLTISYDTTAAAGQSQTAALAGTGQTGSAALTFSPTSFDFSGVAIGSSSGPHGFTVSNGGSASATNVSLALANGAQFKIGSNSCGTASAKVAIAAGATCAFDVTFTPASAGAQSDTVAVTFDASGQSGQTASAALAGTGLDACAGVTCSGHGTCVASQGAATCVCDSGYHASGTSCVADVTSGFGLSIPSDHPRILFNSGNLPGARAWYAAHPFTPRSDDPAGQALRGLLANDASSCAAAVSWAKGASSSIPLSGTACDHCRWDGETIIQVYDWCYGTMSSADRGSLEASIDGWVDHWRTQTWGGRGMFENNYYWGYLRNEMEWGITRWGTNTSLATTELDDALNARLGQDFYPATGAIGGVGQEGAQYGPYLLGYATAPFITAGQMGRDIFNESSYFLSGVYAYIYGSTPSGQLFTWNDNDGYSPSSANNTHIANYMTAAAMHWRSAAVGGHARQWLNDIGGPADRSIQAVDDGTPAARDFSSLPLEYYAAGPKYLYGRSSWSNAATAYMLLLGAENGVGHEHEDYGSFQIWRGDSWLSRESVGYGYSGLNVAGLGGSGSNDVRTAIAHNTVAVGSALPAARGAPVVTRLESQPGYGFASVDLTSAFSGPHVERDFIFVRKLETLVVFDRGANVFLAHCETAPTTSGNQATCTNGPQKLVVTSLVGNPALRVVTEGSQSGQRRIEISTSAVGGANTMLTVLQATDASASAILPTLTDNGASYTLRLGPTVSIDLVKGGTSSGGTITIDGAAYPLRANVQDMAVTPSGPVWR